MNTGIIKAVIMIIFSSLFILNSCYEDSFNKQYKKEAVARRAPSIVSTSPCDGDVDVNINSPVTVKFDVELDPGSVNSMTFIIKDNTNTIVDGNISVSGDTITFTRVNPFRVLRQYTVTVTKSITNFNGIPVSSEASITFTAGHCFDRALELHLPFSGNSLDESGNEYDGLRYGGPILTTDRFGNTDSAYYFDGIDDYIEIKNGINLKPEIITISL